MDDRLLARAFTRDFEMMFDRALDKCDGDIEKVFEFVELRRDIITSIRTLAAYERSIKRGECCGRHSPVDVFPPELREPIHDAIVLLTRMTAGIHYDPGNTGDLGLA